MVVYRQQAPLSTLLSLPLIKVCAPVLPIGALIGAEFYWSTLRKKAHAIMATVERMHCMLVTIDGFNLKTDHHNLVSHFDSCTVVPGLSQILLGKVL